MLLVFFATVLQAQVIGCTDPLSRNFNPAATVNDGSCTYKNTYVNPVRSQVLPAVVKETSGLINLSGKFYTHNDNRDTQLYELDTLSGNVKNNIRIEGVNNIDWEEIAQDDEYIYIGDFGNNATGNRNNLKIYQISREGFAAGKPSVSQIEFTYPDHTVEDASNRTNFDCEAFVVSKDSLYLFTKQWKSKATSVYALPKTSGKYTARLVATHDTEGLITGAAYLHDKQVIVLTGYSKFLQPFFYLLYDFKGENFFSGNKRKVEIDLPYHQVEAVSTNDGIRYFVTNEFFTFLPFIRVSQKLHEFDLSDYLQMHLNTNSPEVHKP